MNPESDIFVTIVTYSYGVAAFFGFLFIIALLRTDWYRHPWGRNVMSFMCCLAPLETYAFTGRYFGDWPGRRIVITFLSVGIALVTAWRWWLQFSGNRRQRKADREIRDLAPRKDAP